MFGERLRLARKRAGLSLRDLAEKINHAASAQAISKYETNAMMPSASVLVALGKALSVSLDFLMSSQVIELASVEFRKKSGTSVSDRAKVEAEVIDQVERYLSIEAILGIDSADNALVGRQKAVVDDIDGAEESAERLRATWELGRDPIASVTALLEDKGIKVVQTDLPDRVAGLTCDVVRPGGLPSVPVIVVSNRTNVERLRFTLAHELAHRIITEGPSINGEKAAHRFAGAFLMPRDHLRAETGAIRHALAFKEFVRLKHTYGVSATALLMRLKDVGVLSEESVTHAFRTVASKWRQREPEPLRGDCQFCVLEKPERFETLVYRALAEDLLTLPKAATLLKKPISDVETAVKGPSYDDEYPR